MGLLSQITGGVINDDGPIISGWNNPTQGGGGGGGGVLGGLFGGQIIPGLDNPFQSGDKTWLPGLGAANPLNSQSVVGQAVKDLGQLNVFNPDTTAGKVTKNIVADIGKDPVKWAAVAVAIAAGQPQLIPSIMSVAKLTSKQSSPEEWIIEGIKAAAIKYGGEWVAKNVAGASGYVGSTDAGQDWIPGTGVAGATGSATAAKVAANAARGMFVAAAQKGSTDINGAQIITSAITNEGLNQAMAEIPGWDTLSKGEQSTAVNAFKVAFNKDQSAAYNLFNQGFEKVLKEAELQAKSLGYSDLKQQVDTNDKVYSTGTAEDRALLNKMEEEYKTTRKVLTEMEATWRTDPVAEASRHFEIIDLKEKLSSDQYKLSILPDDIFFRSKGYEGYGDFSRAANSGVDDPEVWKKIKAIESGGGDDASAMGNARAAYLTALNKARALSSDPNRDEAALAQAREDLDAAAQAVQRLPDELDAKNAGWDSFQERIEARTAGIATPEEWKKSKTTNVVDDLTNAGLHDDLDDTDLTKVVGGTDTTTTKPAEDDRLSQAVEKGKSGDLLGQINLQREIVGMPPYASLEQYYASKDAEDGDDTITSGTGTDTLTGGTGTDTLTGAAGDDTITSGTGADTLTGGTGADITKPAKDDLLSQAVEKGKSGDLLSEINLLREIVGYEPFATLDEYYASKNAEDGDDTLTGTTGADTLTGGTGADTTTGATGDDTVAGGDPFAYYDPETKQYKYGANHGDFNPFNFGLTEEQFLSSGDPWAVYDPDTGQYQYSIGDPDFDPYTYDLVDDNPTNDYKFKLPGLPGGKKPVFKPRVKTTTTTTKTADTGTKTANTGANTTAAPNNMALFALLASMGNQQAPAPAPVIDTTPSEPFDFTSEFEVNPYAKQRSASKMAQGGSIDELLDILRRN